MSETNTATPPVPAAPAAPLPPTNVPPPELDMTPYETEFQTSGKLSDASYQKLNAEYRLPKQMVDGYITSRTQAVEALKQDVFNTVGGQDKYAAMTQWAAASLTPEDTQAFNAAMNSNDPAMIKLAVRGLQQQYSAANGNPPSLIAGGRSTGGVAPFKSKAEMTAAMRDPRYATDEAYRADVEKRLEGFNF